MDIKEEEVLGEALEAHWYYVAKGAVLQKFLRGINCDEVLDVGAGSGVFSRQLLSAGLVKKAICLDTNYEREKTAETCGGRIRFVREADELERDLILMMDVLEHVTDDAAMLRKFTKRLSPGGLLLITVPAFQFLWSGHDVFLEHKRRYTLGGLQQLVQSQGLEVIQARYFFALLFPIVACVRLLNRVFLQKGRVEPKSALRLYPAPVNWLLVGIHRLERFLILPLNRFFGLSIFCLARKPVETR